MVLGVAAAVVMTGCGQASVTAGGGHAADSASTAPASGSRVAPPTPSPLAAPVSPTVPSVPSVASGEVHTRAAAQARADADLASVRVPPGAVEVSSAPDARLAQPFAMSSGTTQVDATRWFTVPGTRSAVEAFFTAHPPVGWTPWGKGTSGTLNDPQLLVGLTFGSGHDELSVDLMQSAGTTDVRIDAQVTWIPPKDRYDSVPGSASSVKLAYDGGLQQPGRPKPRQKTVTLTGGDLARLAKAIDALDVEPPSAHGCPMDDGEHAVLSMQADGHDVTYDIALSGCQGVAVSVDGQRGHFLIGAGDPQHVVRSILGVTPAPSTPPSRPKPKKS
ncbi:MAG: hypothetical protein QOF82_1261 [Frankiales bacterium]|nr:hypothetical protein [Frankiales bacterium]